MIKEQFVSFETAKLLKEAGFNEQCRYNYDNVGGFRWFKIGEPTPKGWVPCPTQALAARWLREVHGLNISACFIYDKSMESGKGWFYMREDTNQNESNSVYCSIENYKSFEEAFEVGLKETLQLIIKNKEQ